MCASWSEELQYFVVTFMNYLLRRGFLLLSRVLNSATRICTMDDLDIVARKLANEHCRKHSHALCQPERNTTLQDERKELPAHKYTPTESAFPANHALLLTFSKQCRARRWPVESIAIRCRGRTDAGVLPDGSCDVFAAL